MRGSRYKRGVNVNFGKRKAEVLRLIGIGITTTTMLSTMLNAPKSTIARDKKKLEEEGLIDAVGKNRGKRIQLSELGLQKLELNASDYKPFEAKEKKQYIDKYEKIYGRRMSVIGYLTFGKKYTMGDIATMLGVNRQTTKADIEHLENNGLINKSKTVTKKGLEMLDNYVCDVY